MLLELSIPLSFFCSIRNTLTKLLPNLTVTRFSSYLGFAHCIVFKQGMRNSIDGTISSLLVAHCQWCV
ncbi:evolutionarily conserved C-terminal region 2 [Zea mays]|uniref:Evolutionarily conserved C-terminal region 2 n=1 Tax=Zea mays TaxID=4577 RepID=A0A1D6KRP6_MAIZE|nr:evolutionarily conserved C-terminal region 2 [Zea mays]